MVLKSPVIIKQDCEITKVRVIFEASPKYKNELSLNEMLDPGPCLLRHILGILLLFRLRKIAVVFNINQAF